MTSVRNNFISHVRSGNLEEVKKAVTTKKDLLRYRDKERFSALHHAAWNGHDKVAEFLLDQDNLDLESKSYNDKTPLTCAADYGHQKVMQLLIKRGANVNHISEYYKTSVLHTLLDAIPEKNNKKIKNFLNCVALLLENKANINEQNRYGETPLMVTSNIPLFKKILEYKPDLEMRSQSGKTVFLTACESSATEIIHLLIERKVNINVVDGKGRSAIDLIIESNSKPNSKLNSINLLLKAKHPDLDPKWIQQAFQKALTKKNADHLKIFLALGIELPVSKSRSEMLNNAYDTEIFDQIFSQMDKEQNPENTDEVLDIDGNSLLIRAMLDKRMDIAEKIIPFSDLNSVNKKNQTALSLAIKMRQPKLVHLLLDHGANPNELNHEGQPIFMEVIKSYDSEKIADIFISKGADLNYICKATGNTPLIQAVLEYHESAVMLILEKNPINIHHQNKEKRDALFIAVYNTVDGNNFERNKNIINQLLLLKANPFAKCTGSYRVTTAYELSSLHYQLKPIFALYKNAFEQSDKNKTPPAPSQDAPHIIYIQNLSQNRVAVCRALFDAAAKSDEGKQMWNYGKKMLCNEPSLWTPLSDGDIHFALSMMRDGNLSAIGYLKVDLKFGFNSLDVTAFEESYGLSAKKILEEMGFNCSDQPMKDKTLSYSYCYPSAGLYGTGKSKSILEDKSNFMVVLSDISLDKRFKQSNQPGVIFEARSFITISDKELNAYGITKFTRNKDEYGDNIVFVHEMIKEQEKISEKYSSFSIK